MAVTGRPENRVLPVRDIAAVSFPVEVNKRDKSESASVSSNERTSEASVTQSDRSSFASEDTHTHTHTQIRVILPWRGTLRQGTRIATARFVRPLRAVSALVASFYRSFVRPLARSPSQSVTHLYLLARTFVKMPK